MSPHRHRVSRLKDSNGLAGEPTGDGAWRAFGRVQVLPLCDARGPFFQPLSDSFSRVSADVRRQARALDPGAFTNQGRWLVHFRCFAVRLPDGRQILVDAGVGPIEAPAADWAPVPGQLPLLLRRAGIELGDISAVVLTHLHSDHIGWAVVDGLPHFPNARYVLQTVEVAALDSSGSGLRRAVVDPLEQSGRLDLIDGTARLAAGVTAIHTPGHTPGHQSVVIRSDDAELMLTGDLLVHALQLADPEVQYTHEQDPVAAYQTRLRVLRDSAERGVVLGTAHLARPFIAPLEPRRHAPHSER